MRGASFLAPVLLLGLFMATGACARADPHELAGDYRRPHTVYVFHGSEPVASAVVDRLILRVAEERHLRFALEVTDDRGRVCEISGVAQARREGFEFRSAAGGCGLRITGGSGSVAVDDRNGSCHERYCRESAALGVVNFARDRDPASGDGRGPAIPAAAPRERR